MSDTILIVDDDARLLEGLRRNLRGRLNVLTAVGGEEALRIIDEQGPIAVILCDMRMPGMDGIAVLQAVRQRSPDTVRMMLTGDADQGTAVDAINKGEIFRFLSKPCGSGLLTASLEAGIRQYRLVTGEKELLERTLAGSVRLLLDALKLSGNSVADAVPELRRWGHSVARALQLPDSWKLDMALMLSGIGSVAIPPSIAAKLAGSEGLNLQERAVVEQAPRFGRDLIANIPRLEAVADIIYLQDRGFDGSGFPADGPKAADIPLESRIIKILKAVWGFVGNGVSLAGAFEALEIKPAPYDPTLLRQIRDTLLAFFGEAAPEKGGRQVVPIALLKPGNVLLSDIRTMEDRLVLAAGERLSPTQVALLRNWMTVAPLREPAEVSAA